MNVEGSLAALAAMVQVVQKLEDGLEAWEMLEEYILMRLNTQANRYYIGLVRLEN